MRPRHRGQLRRVAVGEHARSAKLVFRARVVIDACKPFSRRDSFPLVVRNSKELDARIIEKFKDILPRR